jgi:HK97 family phage major capsid protein
MTVYNNIITRSSSNPPAMVSDDASALIPEDVAKEIIKGATVKSAVMQLFKTRRMSRKQQRLPVVSLLPFAYWVSGDNGLKQTTEVDWKNVYLNAEEMAVLVPIPKSLIADMDYSLWDEVKPLLEEAVAVTLDDAVLFGTNAPASFPSSLVSAAASAGNSVTRGASAIDVADDLNNVMAAVEADGYDVNGWVLRTQMKGVLRGLRSTQKELIFQRAGDAVGISNAGFEYQLWGEKAYVSKSGFSSFNSTGGAGFYEAICGDWNQGILGIREDITFEMFDQGVIQDGSGAIIMNLMQQDSVAMRLTFRAGFAVPNPVNRQQTTDANRYPFGCLRQT